MTTLEQLIHEVDVLIQDLRLPLSSEEVAVGWTAQSQTTTINWLAAIRGTLINRQPLENLNIVRGLDHWGVEAGSLFGRACALSNKLRAYNQRDADKKPAI